MWTKFVKRQRRDRSLASICGLLREHLSTSASRIRPPGSAAIGLLWRQPFHGDRNVGSSSKRATAAAATGAGPRAAEGVWGWCCPGRASGQSLEPTAAVGDWRVPCDTSRSRAVVAAVRKLWRSGHVASRQRYARAIVRLYRHAEPFRCGDLAGLVPFFRLRGIPSPPPHDDDGAGREGAGSPWRTTPCVGTSRPLHPGEEPGSAPVKRGSVTQRLRENQEVAFRGRGARTNRRNRGNHTAGESS